MWKRAVNERLGDLASTKTPLVSISRQVTENPVSRYASCHWLPTGSLRE